MGEFVDAAQEKLSKLEIPVLNKCINQDKTIPLDRDMQAIAIKPDEIYGEGADCVAIVEMQNKVYILSIEIKGSKNLDLNELEKCIKQLNSTSEKLSELFTELKREIKKESHFFPILIYKSGLPKRSIIQVTKNDRIRSPLSNIRKSIQPFRYDEASNIRSLIEKIIQKIEKH